MLRNRSRPEWFGVARGVDPDGAPGEEDSADPVLSALSTSSLAFQAILDDLVRTVGETEARAPPPRLPRLPQPPRPPRPRRNCPERGHDTPSQDSGDGVLRPLDVREPGAEADVGAGPARGAVAGARAAPPAPVLLRGRGDLTLVVGLGGDAVATARMLAAAIGDAEVRPGGCARAAAPRVDDRRGALRARADGVRRERAIVAAFGIARGASEIPALAESLAGIEPDQVWLAVDASRKADDTAAWVRAVDAILGADGLAVTGTTLTATPDSVRELGLPVGWVDGTQAGIS